MKYKDEDPDNLGGLGGMLPAEVLKLINELLEQQHQAGHNNHGSTVINIYEKGSMHIDRVDSQNFYGDKWSKALQGNEPAENLQSPDLSFDDSTPLSALFRKNHHEELRKVIDSWRPYLINDPKETDALSLTYFTFDMTTIRPVSIYMDLTHLVNHDALRPPMSVLARYMYQHSNLSRSKNALYVQLKRYRKMCE